MGRSFFVTVSYELDPKTPSDARKLFRAELVGRGFQDRARTLLMPSNSVWGVRVATDEQTTDDLHQVCARDLRGAAAAVAQTGRHIQIVRAWIHVSGGGTFGLAAPEALAHDAPTSGSQEG
ncbi:MAG: hypothetical protein IPK82_04615 [Polyangiaceae bacterium]|nr:hypothetical protein [Polyangiaceae bacterium]